MKAFQRQIAYLKRVEDIDSKLFQTVSHFLLHGVVKKDLKEAGTPEEEEQKAQVVPQQTSVDKYCKVREIALKILHMAWKAWFDRVESNPNRGN